MTLTPKIGASVMYVPSEKEREKMGGDIFPAIIVKVHATDMVNLKVFTNAERDEWVTSVEINGKKQPRSWHWPETGNQ